MTGRVEAPYLNSVKHSHPFIKHSPIHLTILGPNKFTDTYCTHLSMPNSIQSNSIQSSIFIHTKTIPLIHPIISHLTVLVLSHHSTSRPNIFSHSSTLSSIQSSIHIHPSRTHFNRAQYNHDPIHFIISLTHSTIHPKQFTHSPLSFLHPVMAQELEQPTHLD